MAVQAAVTLVMAHSSMNRLLRRLRGSDGDVETVAAVALAAGACSVEIVQDLPEHLVAGLENGPYGRDFLTQLDEQLMKRVR